MNELFKIDMDKREIVLNYKHYNVNVDILNYIVDLLKQLEAYENMRKEAIEYIENHIKYENDDSFNGMQFFSYHLYDFDKKDLLNILNKMMKLINYRKN